MSNQTVILDIRKLHDTIDRLEKTLEVLQYNQERMKDHLECLEESFRDHTYQDDH